MSLTEEVDVKKTESAIKASLKRGTKFMLYEGLSYQPSKFITETREEQVEFKVASGTYFTLGDYFVLMAVQSLGVTTIPILLRKLGIEKKRNPEKEIPFHTSQSLKARLNFLTKNGMLFCFEYLDKNGMCIFVYSCTMFGWRAFKNRLQSPAQYDKNIVFRPESEVFRRLAANAVAYSFAFHEGCNGVVLNETVSYGANERRGYILASTSLTKEDKKIRYIIEPVYFRIDNRILSDEENDKQINQRLSQLQDIVESFNQETETKLVLVVEDLEGLSKLVGILRTKEMSFFMNNSLFTADNVLTDNNGELDKAFLKIVQRGDKYSLVLAQDAIM